MNIQLLAASTNYNSTGQQWKPPATVNWKSTTPYMQFEMTHKKSLVLPAQTLSCNDLTRKGYWDFEENVRKNGYTVEATDTGINIKGKLVKDSTIFKLYNRALTYSYFFLDPKKQYNLSISIVDNGSIWHNEYAKTDIDPNEPGNTIAVYFNNTGDKYLIKPSNFNSTKDGYITIPRDTKEYSLNFTITGYEYFDELYFKTYSSNHVDFSIKSVSIIEIDQEK